MTASQSPRYTVEKLSAHYYAVRDTRTGLVMATRTKVSDAQTAADHRNQLDALGIRAGDTVTGTTTGTHPRRFTVTVDREPWIVGTRGGVAVSDGRSVEMLELDGLEVNRAADGSEHPDPTA